MRHFYLLFPAFLLVLYAPAQSRIKNFYLVPSITADQLNSEDKKNLDSLLIIYHRTTSDTTHIAQIENLIEVCTDDKIWPKHNEFLRDLCTKMLARTNLSSQEKRVYKRGLASSYNNTAFFQLGVSQDSLAEINYNECLKISKEINDVRSIGACYNNLGRIYKARGDIPRALDSYIASLSIQEKIGDEKGMSYSFNNIGSVYRMIDQVDKATEFINKSLSIRRKIKDYQGIANNLAQLGLIELEEKKDPMKGLDYFREALNLRLQFFNYNRAAESYLSIGQCYFKLKNTDSTVANYLRGIKLAIETDNQSTLADLYTYLAFVYIETGDIQLALNYAKKGFEISQKVKHPLIISRAANTLSQVYDKQKNYPEAYRYYKVHIRMRDSINNNELKKASLSKQFKFEYDKKALTDSLKNEEQRSVERAKYEEDVAKQKIVALSGGIAFLFMAFIAVISFRAYRQKRRSNLIIEAQKTEVEHQKNLVEEKNKEITDSINYANRIQKSIIANKEILDKHLSQYLIYFQPKDIVSGDFYWATEHHGKFYIACCDSTGHGVPGAFMSLLNIGYLSEAINEKNIEQPSRVFDYVRQKLIVNLGKDGQKDGFDGILFCFDKQSQVASYAAANNSPILIRDKQIVELPNDKMPVGKGELEKNFTHFTLEYKPNDSLYLYTDGYADQFGGPKGKKFKYKQLDELLLSISDLSAEKQQDLLRKQFTDWKGNLEQIDDVCVLGIKL